MAYEKHTWETGETITAEKLNNLEDGVSGNNSDLFIVTVIQDGNNIGLADKTIAEISEAWESGKIIVFKLANEYSSYGTTFGTYAYILANDITTTGGHISNIGGSAVISTSVNNTNYITTMNTIKVHITQDNQVSITEGYIEFN